MLVPLFIRKELNVNRKKVAFVCDIAFKQYHTKVLHCNLVKCLYTSCMPVVLIDTLLLDYVAVIYRKDQTNRPNKGLVCDFVL